jgi:glycosyltransferase involved in cell wall biosynthesis
VSNDHRRVVFVAQTYLPAVDGTAVLIQNLAERFAADGDDVHVLTTNALSPTGFRTARKGRLTAPPLEKIHGVSVHRLTTRWWSSAMCRPIHGLIGRASARAGEYLGDAYLGPTMRGLGATLARLEPGVIYTSSFPYRHVHDVVAWGERTGVPVVVHGAIHPEDSWAFVRRSVARTCRRAARYAANTEYEARYVQGLGVAPERIAVVGAGTDPDRLTGAAEPGSDREDTSEPYILYFGHLAARKGLDTFIAALPSIWSRHPTARVVIAGKTTDDTERLHDAAVQISAGHDMSWLPDVSEPRKAALMAASSMVVYPSRAESLGLVFLEAWSFGVPVIGCSAGAVTDVIDDGVTGLLVSTDDHRALADGVVRLIDDPGAARRMGDAGRRLVHERYTWTAVARRAREAIDSAVRGDGG